MRTLLRSIMLIALFVAFAGTVVSILADTTGPLEKLVLAVLAAGLLWVASRVRHGRRPSLAD
jgi:hypothetical protein